MAVVTPEFEDLYVSNEFPQFEIDEIIALPEYVYLLFNSRKLIQAVNAASIGSSAVSRNRFKESDFLGFRVPVPPLPAQNKIVAYWKNEMQKVNDELFCLEQAESQVTLNILSGAGIKINLGKKLPSILTKRFSDFERWGVSFNRYSWKLSSLITSSPFDCSPLSRVAWINPGIDLILKDSDFVTFIPMEAVDDKDGVIKSPEIKSLAQVKSGYTRFMEGDVLWAKITPCMQNGKSAIARNLENGIGFGSTEFHLIRSKDESTLKNEFIHLILRLPEIRKAAMRYFVGSAGQQRVPKEFLEDLYIPIPPINSQIRLIEKINIKREKIEKARESILTSKNNLNIAIEKLILGTLSVEDL